jgi:hypothetical protein
MSDPYEIWRKADGQSKQKSVRMFWPELADALGGAVDGGDAPEQPPCAGCGAATGKLASGKTGRGTPICPGCASLSPWRSEGPAKRVPEWVIGYRKRR